MKLSFSLIFLIIAWAASAPAYPGKVINKIKTPHTRPTGLAFDGKNLWIADHKADKLTCLERTTGKVIKEIASPGFWPMGLAWDGKYLWNIDLKMKKIFKIDTSDGSILKAIDSPSESPEGLAWDGHTLWVSDPREKTIMKIDLSDGTALETFAAPAQFAQGMTFDGTYIWCADRLSDELHMIDPKNGEVIIVLKSPGPYPRGLAWDGKYLWNSDYQRDSIYQLARQDDEIFKLENPKNYRLTFTHEAKIYGQGMLQELNAYIAIPENLPQQEILNTKFEPAGCLTVKDKWGQSYAQFKYQNKQSEAVLRSVMTIDMKLSEINYFIFPDRCGTLADIPADIKKTYTENDSKYLTDDPYIQGIAKKILEETKNPYWIARRIFDTVRIRLEYKMEGGWNVAPVVLKRGTGSCSEYTFSFISLCRAAGLPARYAGSVVVRGDDASLDDVFHRWPEIYLPNYGWIPIDPQGGDKPVPRDRAMNIGHLPNRFLITTRCGGDSEYMGWYYNSNENYKTDPQIQVNIESFGEWELLETAK